MLAPGRWHPLADGLPPAWASGWGEDEYGVWVTIDVSGVFQKMRWIESGTFIMGSPEDEPGQLTEEELEEYNLKPENPQHTVELTQGFWLFDTPVTQALYTAVIGDNPGKYKSQQRPVEQVSWQDAQTFIQQLNKQIPDLNVSLPTETQWEYACRAATTEATYVGEMEILGQNNVPVLNEIAWYGGNSGVDFDLENGHDSSKWPEKQFNHQQAGSRIVAQKKANPWGLYDMLGNIWEWCEDGQRAYTNELTIDPVGSLDDGAYRVLRGGSWSSNARDVRCAFRNALRQEGASSVTGFRCARVHDEQRSGNR
jgi:formylglycine-generating enzyme required for sulfatase activity